MAQVHVILAELGTLETRLIDLTKERQEHENKKAELMSTIDSKEHRLKELKEEKLESQKAVDALNLSIAEHEAKTKNLEDKRKYILSGGGKNADLAIITKQMDDVKADQGVLEEKLYVLWEKVDKIQVKIDQAADEFNTFKGSVHKDAEQIDIQISGIGSRINALNGQIDGKLENLKSANGEAYEFYARLRDKAVAPAAVFISDGNCQGCFLALPPDIVNKIYDSVDVIKCPNCYRFLYVSEEPEEAETE